MGACSAFSPLHVQQVVKGALTPARPGKFPIPGFGAGVYGPEVCQQEIPFTSAVWTHVLGIQPLCSGLGNALTYASRLKPHYLLIFGEPVVVGLASERKYPPKSKKKPSFVPRALLTLTFH